MKLQRQHFLLSYLKSLSVGPVGVSNSRPPAAQPGAQPSEPPVRGVLDNKAFQYGNPQNLYGKDSPIHRLLLHRDFHGLFSPPKVLRIRKIHVDIHVG